MQRKLSYIHVPYKGTAEQMLAVASGQLMAGVNSNGFAPYVESGKLRLLVTFSDRRSARWASVPTLKELGFGITAMSPYGLVGPRGMDPAVVKKMGGRVDTQTFLRELYRGEGRLASIYDSNVTTWDPYPWSNGQKAGDPILDAIIAPTTSAMVEFTTHTVGWKVEGRYNALSNAVNAAWEPNWFNNIESVTDLRQAVAADGKMKVLIVHGYDDLSCPFFASRLIVDQMPPMGGAGRVKLALYPGGHMFYSRGASMAAFRRDVMALYGVN